MSMQDFAGNDSGDYGVAGAAPVLAAATGACDEADVANVSNDVFRHLPMANEEPAHPLASYYCDECGEPDWVDTHQGGDIREFYADEEQGDIICEPCARLRAANAENQALPR